MLLLRGQVVSVQPSSNVATTTNCDIMHLVRECVCVLATFDLFLTADNCNNYFVVRLRVPSFPVVAVVVTFASLDWK